MYHPAGRYEDESGKRFDVIGTVSEVDVYVRAAIKHGRLLIYNDGLANQLDDEAIRLRRGCRQLPKKSERLYPFGVGRYAFSQMCGTIKLIAPNAEYPPDAAARQTAYDRKIEEYHRTLKT